MSRYVGCAVGFAAFFAALVFLVDDVALDIVMRQP